MEENLPVVVIGAGPVGLAAAAHLRERGLEPLVLEAGAGPAAAVAAWGHVRLFSPWRYDVDAAARRLLTRTGWAEPDPDALPTGADLVDRYLAPLAAALGDAVRHGARVVAVARDGADRTRSHDRADRPYLVRWTSGGMTHETRARAVLDASGTTGTPNPLGRSGLPALGEERVREHLAGPLPDVLGAGRARFAGRTTLVAGRGHSAANALLGLVELARDEPGTRVLWAIRGSSPRRLYGGGADDELPARGLLGTRLRDAVGSGAVELLTRVVIDRLEPVQGGVRVHGASAAGPLDLTVDTVVNATGFRPDLGLLREVRLDLDPVVEAPRALAPLIDPNLHSCGTVPAHGERELAHPDDGFYLVGAKAYGRAPTFLLATGYEQVRSVAAALAGDRAAADAVELALPGTGVCSSDLALAASADGTVAAAERALAFADPTGGGCCAVPSGPQPVTLGTAPAGDQPLTPRGRRRDR
ncbi:NAD(P)-binding protein [Promicromonospora citrea]|uniref:Flavoprotein n=1 Tax=Promicromonospora citrea TaxID=43677 RepID=A0A8H9L201_9MICO|nr:NAD(P)-binding protein [Promicromonospora citrea]NNH53885.1 FAD-dependent oxidoreductase [Promicromonospora citrea]GGM18729.1 flavoprotein [Promicromonospora citrea]